MSMLTERLFFLDWLGSRILSVKTDGSDVRTVVSTNCKEPDGIAVDVEAGHLYWTNMGTPEGDDGFILRSDLDGNDITTVVPVGDTFTPKQLQLDRANGKLYWSDREGMRIMRSNTDGSGTETLITFGVGDQDRADQTHWGVGMALDIEARQFYWTLKGGDDAGLGVIKRAGFDMPAGEDDTSRSDIEVLFEGLPEPIDVELDIENQQLYWTDRGDNTVSRACMNLPVGSTAGNRQDREILVTGVKAAIGLALDRQRRRMFYTTLFEAKIGAADMDGGGATWIHTSEGSNLTGIAFVRLPD
jgi:hypothetical protein